MFVAAAVASVLAACGADDGPVTGASPGPTVATPGSSSAPSEVAGRFPVSVTRSGGFAGVDDAVVVAADGSATVKRRSGRPTPVTLTAEQLAELRTLLASPALAAEAAGPAQRESCADGFTVTLTTGSVRATSYSCAPPGDRPTVTAITSLLLSLTPR